MVFCVVWFFFFFGRLFSERRNDLELEYSELRGDEMSHLQRRKLEITWDIIIEQCFEDT